MKIVFYPRFESPADLADHYYRTGWYLTPFKQHLREIVVLTAPGLTAPPPMPPFLDSSLPSKTAGLPLTIEEAAEEDKLSSHAKDADLILLWRSDLSAANGVPSALAGKRVVRIDHKNLQFAGSFYLKIAELIDRESSTHVERSRKIFEEIAARCAARVGYIFGTGPELARASHHDFSDGVSIACNSMVKNSDLLKRLNPPLIVVGDPIFHAGPSSYAEAFRRALIDAMDCYGSFLIVPMRDFHVYLEHLPERFHDRIAAIPFATRDEPNLNLKDEFSVTSTGNVLTLFLLPLATTFFDTIRIFGCDGRPLDANTYFWGHDKATQFNDEMEAIRLAHPGFFAIDYDDYYSTHCRTLDRWLKAAEGLGKHVTNHTPSHIAALQSRSVEGVNTPGRPAATAKQRQPEISIIMPCFNAARFVETAVASVTSQGREDWELLIVDDGSTDGSQSIAATLAASDNRIRSIANTRRKGVSGARNCGIDNARGRLLAFLDADDTYDIGAISERIAYFRDHPEAKMIHGHVRYIDENGADLGARMGMQRDVIYPDASLGNPCHLNTLTVVRHAIGELRFDEDTRNGEDWLFVASLLRSGLNSNYVARGSATYRVHAQSTVLSDMRSHESSLEAVLDWIHQPVDEPWVAPEYAKPTGLAPREPTIMSRRVNLAIWNVLNGCSPTETTSQAISDSVRNSLSTQSLRGQVQLAGVRTFCIAENQLSRQSDDIKQRISKALAAHRIPYSSALGSAFSEVFGLATSFESDRAEHAHVDETEVVAHMLSARKGPRHVMLDVGAHFGTSASYFHKLGWSIHCFEPDPKNREKLVSRLGSADNVTIDPRAVSDTPATGLTFFTSEESTGISGLLAFADSHVSAYRVDATTLAAVTDEREIKSVDFVKIDVEGFDLNVLKGMPWDKVEPDVIEAEFEDAKTKLLGHSYVDICEFLRARGYSVYLSEWHPIIKYGTPHDWRRIIRYPERLPAADAWGNILAFRDDPGFEAVLSAFGVLVRRRKVRSQRTLSTADTSRWHDVKSAPRSTRFQFLPTAKFTLLDSRTWEYDASKAGNSYWIGFRSIPTDTAGCAFIGGMRISVDQPTVIRVSLARHGEGPYEGSARHVSLQPNTEAHVSVSAEFQRSHASLKLQIEVLSAQENCNTHMTVSGLHILESLSSIEGRFEHQEITIREANRLFRMSDFSTALGMYILLHERLELPMYLDNAARASAALGIDHFDRKSILEMYRNSRNSVLHQYST